MGHLLLVSAPPTAERAGWPCVGARVGLNVRDEGRGGGAGRHHGKLGDARLRLGCGLALLPRLARRGAASDPRQRKHRGAQATVTSTAPPSEPTWCLAAVLLRLGGRRQLNWLVLGNVPQVCSCWVEHLVALRSLQRLRSLRWSHPWRNFLRGGSHQRPALAIDMRRPHVSETSPATRPDTSTPGDPGELRS